MMIWGVIISPPVLNFTINLHISSIFFQSTFISPPLSSNQPSYLLHNFFTCQKLVVVAEKMIIYFYLT